MEVEVAGDPARGVDRALRQGLTQRQGRGDVAVRAANLAVASASQDITLEPGVPRTIQWRVRRVNGAEPWLAVVAERLGAHVQAYLARVRSVRH